MRLIRDGVVASLLLMAMGAMLIFSFSWEWEAGARVIALVSSGLWGYVLVGQLFVIQAHVRGEVNAALGMHGTSTMLDAGATLVTDESNGVERMIPVHYAAHSRVTPIAVADTTPREIELPTGQRIPRDDVIAFVDGLDAKGHGRKNWIGCRLPSGKTIDTGYFQLLIQAIRLTGELPRYGQGVRSVRTLTTHEIKQRLHLDI